MIPSAIGTIPSSPIGPQYIVLSSTMSCSCDREGPVPNATRWKVPSRSRASQCLRVEPRQLPRPRRARVEGDGLRRMRRCGIRGGLRRRADPERHEVECALEVACLRVEPRPASNAPLWYIIRCGLRLRADPERHDVECALEVACLRAQPRQLPRPRRARGRRPASNAPLWYIIRCGLRRRADPERHEVECALEVACLRAEPRQLPRARRARVEGGGLRRMRRCGIRSADWRGLGSSSSRVSRSSRRTISFHFSNAPGGAPEENLVELRCSQGVRDDNRCTRCLVKLQDCHTRTSVSRSRRASSR